MKNKIHIAILDDHLPLGSFLKTVLEDEGYKVPLLAQDGKVFLEELLHLIPLPQICIVDGQMPKISGAEVSKAIKTAYPNIKVLGFSFSEQEKKQMMASGCDVYLLKEVGMEGLIDRLQEMTRR